MWKLLSLKKSPDPSEPPVLPKATPDAFPLKHFLQVLQREGDYTNALNFLLAFPRFQKQVVLINDHSELNRSYKLSQLTGAALISIWDYDKLVSQCSARTGQYSLKIFAYDHAEEKLNTTEFNDSRNCLYARHLDENSLVMMRCLMLRRGTTSAFAAMAAHAAKSRSWCTCISKSLLRLGDLPESSAVFSKSPVDPPGDVSYFRGISLTEECSNKDMSWLHYSHVRRLLSLAQGGMRTKQRPITDIYVEGYYDLFIYSYVGPLTRVRKAVVHMNGDGQYEESCQASFRCLLPRLDNFHLKFCGCQFPQLNSDFCPVKETLGARNNSVRSKAVFTLINESWRADEPHYHNGCILHKYSPANNPIVLALLDHIPICHMSFTANFGIINYKGITDGYLSRTRIDQVRELYWERVSTVTPFRTKDGIRAITASVPKLKKLTLCSAVVGKAGPMPTFECPKLRYLKLVSLVGTDKKWDLAHLLQQGKPTHLTDLEFNGFWWSNAPDESMAMTGDDLAFVAYKVENLSVKGYRPDFVLSQSGKDVECRYYYPMLKDLTIDITRIPLCASVMAPSPDKCMLMVDFFNASFPVIEAVSLVIPYGGSTGVVPQAKTLSVFVPPSVTQVQVSSSWFSNGRVLEINGLRVDQGKREGVLETKRTGRQWTRSMKGIFEFAQALILEEWEDCCVK